MNKDEAIEKIVDIVYEYLVDEAVKELVEKYSDNRLYIFPMKEFNDFCKEHFPGQYLQVACYLYEAMDYMDFNERDEWVAWDESHKEFKSANEAAHFVSEFDIFPEIIEKAVLNRDPILDAIDIKEEIKAILGN